MRQRRNYKTRRLDAEWCAARLSEGSSYRDVLRIAAQPVSPEAFVHYHEDDRIAAIEYEESRRNSVKKMSLAAIFRDVKQLADKAIEDGADHYAGILDRTIRELSRRAFADWRGAVDITDGQAKVVDSFDLAEGDAGAITSIKITTGESGESFTEIKVDAAVQTQALGHLVKHLGKAGHPVDLNQIVQAFAESGNTDALNRVLAGESPLAILVEEMRNRPKPNGDEE